MGLNAFPKPENELFIKADKTKNGNKEGKILFFQILKEKDMESIIVCEDDNISNIIKSKIVIIKTLKKIFFIKSPPNDNIK